MSFPVCQELLKGKWGDYCGGVRRMAGYKPSSSGGQVLFPPGPGGVGAVCQQPGSPRWPQQLCHLLNFMALFLNTKKSFLCQGMGADILVKIDLKLGIVSIPYCYFTSSSDSHPHPTVLPPGNVYS